MVRCLATLCHSVEPNFGRVRSPKLCGYSPDTLSYKFRRIHNFLTIQGPRMMQSRVLRWIMRELHGLQENPLDDIRVSINEDDVLQFQGIIAGPGARVFRGGVAMRVLPGIRFTTLEWKPFADDAYRRYSVPWWLV